MKKSHGKGYTMNVQYMHHKPDQKIDLLSDRDYNVDMDYNVDVDQKSVDEFIQNRLEDYSFSNTAEVVGEPWWRMSLEMRMKTIGLVQIEQLLGFFRYAETYAVVSGELDDEGVYSLRNVRNTLMSKLK